MKKNVHIILYSVAPNEEVLKAVHDCSVVTPFLSSQKQPRAWWPRKHFWITSIPFKICFLIFSSASIYKSNQSTRI